MPLILLIVKIYIKILISKVYKLTMKILAIQNRMGIGDTVIFLPFIKAISKKFGAPVSLLVKENSKANEFLNQTNYIDEIIHLERDNKINQKHDGFKGFFKLVSDIKKYNFDKVFIFNSSLRYNLISRLAGIKEIFQYPLFEKQNQHITEPAKGIIKKYLDIDCYKNTKLILFLLFTLEILFAGTTGKISGKVVDEYNKPLTEINISINKRSKCLTFLQIQNHQSLR